MLKLRHLINEIVNGPKAIIMAGGASVGKSTLLKSLSNSLEGFEVINADKHVEDKASPMYGNLAAASSHIKKVELPNAIKSKRNLVYDTTASNLKTMTPIIQELKDAGYDIMMVMVYAHPIVSFVRNFKRERKLPAAAVLSTWINTYSLIEDYKKIFGPKFILVKMPDVKPEEQAEVENFQKAMDAGQLKEYFQNLIASGKLFSSFIKKDYGNMTPEELEKKRKEREKTRQILNQSIDKIADMFGKIESSVDTTDLSATTSKVRQFID